MSHLAPIALIAVLCAPVLAAPAAADDALGEDGGGFNLMEEGARLFFRGLTNEMEPALEDLRGMAEDLGPALQLFADDLGQALAVLVERVDDFRYYDMPEFLDNGDIIIRRRPDAPPWTPPQAAAPEPAPEIDI